MKLNVLYSTDDNYAKYGGVSMLSLFENNKNIDEICVYIIDNKISKENKEKLSEIANVYNRNLVFIDGSDMLRKTEKKDDFPIAAYGRLFISNLINVDKILYLDCDTIINGSLKHLWLKNIDDFFVAGVQDNPAKYNVSIIGMDDNDRYLNSGILLINLSLWRKNKLEKKFVEFINKYRGNVPHHDQGIINGVCKGRILILEPEFNLMPPFLHMNRMQIMKLYNIKKYYTQQQINSAIKDPVIIHFISKFYNRPWNKECTHPFKKLYEKYLNLSPWNNKLSNSPLDTKVQIRKRVYEKMPFFIYHLFEKILDTKRKRFIKRQYKFLNIKF
ncbi:glycosyltransferase family 8 protein [Bacillus sp. AFS017274]|uniref:glycosyltransferase family 8 protein n=1 Tax=Bacillus sp. AFS017274 TaxID=2033488 RepID=UPI000BF8F37B|nr:glycosyltransferase family 8 protein [Bacillus sp. AFS017274]PEZ83313.1 glycosyl transferase family 8 [Bacillus sp. AFS017274]